MGTPSLAAKRLDLLHKLVPNAATIGVIIDPTSPGFNPQQMPTVSDAGTVQCHPDDVYLSRVRSRRRVDELCVQHHRGLPNNRHLRRQRSQGEKLADLPVQQPTKFELV